MAERIDFHARVSEWREQLLDLSKRNRLINCRIGRGGALEIEHPASKEVWRQVVVESGRPTFPRKSELLGRPEDDDLPLFDEGSPADSGALSNNDLEACLQSGLLEPSHILTTMTDKALNARLNRLALAAKTSLSEQGVNNLFLAFGLLRWFESKDSETPLLSPVLLVPARLTRQSSDSEWVLSLLEEELVPNHCLNELLRASFGLQMPPTEDESAMQSPDAIGQYFDRLRGALADHQRWEVQDRCLLGAFGFQKVAMWQDLGRNEQRVADHPVCRAIGGDRHALQYSDCLNVKDFNELDEATPPQAAYHILDCDGSQQLAIETVKAGSHLVLDGPPGTGKSQTIANVIAECLANRQTVLFVSEKAAALEVVKRRLDQAGLGDFCLELHSHKANKKEVIANLGEALKLSAERHPPQEADLEALRVVRSQLNSYARTAQATIRA